MYETIVLRTIGGAQEIIIAIDTHNASSMVVPSNPLPLEFGPVLQSPTQLLPQQARVQQIFATRSKSMQRKVRPTHAKETAQWARGILVAGLIASPATNYRVFSADMTRSGAQDKQHCRGGGGKIPRSARIH